MLRLLTYLFSLIFPDQNDYLDEYAYDSECEYVYNKANSMELDVDTTDPTHFFMYG
jgi:hypothetical protein